MVRVIVIGSASGVPVAHRSHASFVLDVDGYLFLFDVGEGCSSSLIRHGVDYHRLSVAFITHCHPDHCTGLPMLLQMLFLLERRSPLTVYLPAEAIDRMREFLHTIYLFSEKLPYHLELLPIKPNPIYRDPRVEVFGFQNPHLEGYKAMVEQSHPQSRLECYSLVIIAEGKRVVYSGDISSPWDLSNFLDNPDLLIIEVTHSEPEEIFRFLAEMGVRRTLLTHIPPTLEGKELYLLQLAEKFGVKGVSIAYDGLELNL